MSEPPTWTVIARSLLANPTLEALEEALREAYVKGFNDGMEDEQGYVAGRLRYGLKPYSEDMGR